MTLIDFTGPLPPKAAVIDQDAIVKKLVNQFGLAEEFARETPRLTVIVPYEDHPTHWCIFTRCSGFARDAENGWRAEFLPKLAFGRVDLDRILHERAAACGGRWAERP